MIIDKPISKEELKALTPNYFEDMVKAVADIRRSLVAVHAEMHADLERELLEDGSRQEDLWGFNIYPDAEGEAMLEFDSLINIRPWMHNMGRGIDDPEVRKAVADLVLRLVR